MSRLSAGSMDAEIGGHDYTLKVTVFAMEQINRRFGDIYSAIQKCAKGSYDDVVFVLQKAAGVQKARVDDLKEHVLIEGVGPSGVIAAEYLGMLYDPSGSEQSEGDSEGE